MSRKRSESSVARTTPFAQSGDCALVRLLSSQCLDDVERGLEKAVKAIDAAGRPNQQVQNSFAIALRRSQNAAEFGNLMQDCVRAPRPLRIRLLLFHSTLVDSTVLSDSIVRIASWVADHCITGAGDFQSARGLLLREPPSVLQNHVGTLIGEDEQLTEAAKILTSLPWKDQYFGFSIYEQDRQYDRLWQ